MISMPDRGIFAVKVKLILNALIYIGLIYIYSTSLIVLHVFIAPVNKINLCMILVHKVSGEVFPFLQ